MKVKFSLEAEANPREVSVMSREDSSVSKEALVKVKAVLQGRPGGTTLPSYRTRGHTVIFGKGDGLGVKPGALSCPAV